MNTESSPIVSVTRRFIASAECVFDAWLDADNAGRWLFATETGEMVRVEIDARVGGAFTFVDRRDGEDVEHTGTYLELDRPRHLVFTFCVPKYSTDSVRVEIDIVALETGCELTLTQTIHPKWAEYADRSREGWATILGNLAEALGEE